MSADPEALRLELIGAWCAGAVTRDLVDDVVAALEQAERELEARDAYLKHVEAISDDCRNRAERVETAARQVEAFGWGENGPAELQTAIRDLRAALTPAPEGGS